MDIYDRIGVEKLINAAGNNTNIGGWLMAPEVFEAMMEAGRSFVDLVELSQKVGVEIARLARVEAAHGGLVVAPALRPEVKGFTAHARTTTILTEVWLDE